MIKRAEEILRSEILAVLAAKTQKEFNGPLKKIADLANILDQIGDVVGADRLDNLIKQAGFWDALFSGGFGGGGAKLWDAIKGGNLKESLGEIVRGALMGAAAGVMADYMIKWLDDVPLIGSYLKELEGANKIRALLEGIIGKTFSESNFANKLVDNSLEEIENLLGMTKKNNHISNKSQSEVPGVRSNNTDQFELKMPETFNV